MAYTVRGPFVDGGPPGVDHNFLNGLETWIEQVDNSTAVVLNGSTSGTATLYQPFAGFFKVVMVYCNNFRNGSAPVQNLVLPTAFTTSLFVINGGTPSISLMKAGVAQTIQTTTSLGTSGGVTPVTSLGVNDWSHMDTGFDTIQFNGSQASAGSGLYLFIGL